MIRHDVFKEIAQMAFVVNRTLARLGMSQKLAKRPVVKIKVEDPRYFLEVRDAVEMKASFGNMEAPTYPTSETIAFTLADVDVVVSCDHKLDTPLGPVGMSEVTYQRYELPPDEEDEV